MTPVLFPQHTLVLRRPPGMTDEECGPLPIWQGEGMCVSCWKMTLRERLSALLFGRVWLHVQSGLTQPPVALDARRTTIFREVPQ